MQRLAPGGEALSREQRHKNPRTDLESRIRYFLWKTYERTEQLVHVAVDPASGDQKVEWRQREWQEVKNDEREQQFAKACANAANGHDLWYSRFDHTMHITRKVNFHGHARRGLEGYVSCSNVLHLHGKHLMTINGNSVMLRSEAREHEPNEC